MDEVFICKRLRLYNYLSKMGFKPFGTAIDKTNPDYTNWLFDVTPELTETIRRWFGEDCYSARMKRRLYTYAEEEISN